MRLQKLFQSLAVLGIISALMLSLMLAAAQDGSTPEPTSVPQQFDLPIQGDVTYLVEPRDTLDEIGAVFDVRVACIRETNNLTRTDIIRPGDPLIISASCPAYDGVLEVEFPRVSSPGRTGDDGTYVVRPNDTLDTIGQRLNVSAISLARANNISNTKRLAIGTVLQIPADAPPYGVVPPLDSAPQVAAAAATPENPNFTPLSSLTRESGTYVVQPGDTLDVIAQTIDVSVVSLQIANDITYGRSLMPGQTIFIPADAPPYGQFPALNVSRGGADPGAPSSADGEQYVIQPGDTLDTIAQEFNVSVVAIRQVNGIDFSTQVTPGRSILIPADAPPYGEFPSSEEAAGGVIASGEQYVIQPNDTLDGIGARFDKDTLCIIQANEITNVRAIRPGQVIGIPADCPQYTGFDVVPGRTQTPPTLVPTTAPQATQTPTS